MTPSSSEPAKRHKEEFAGTSTGIATVEPTNTEGFSAKQEEPVYDTHYEEQGYEATQEEDVYEGDTGDLATVRI